MRITNPEVVGFKWWNGNLPSGVRRNVRLKNIQGRAIFLKAQPVAH